MNVPAESELTTYVEGAYFHDTYSATLIDPNQTAMEAYLAIFTKTPPIVAALMNMRNAIVSKLGLKNLGAMNEIKESKTASDYKVGDMAGIFSLVSLSDSEVIGEDSDKHLDVRVSFYIEKQAGKSILHATTVVHVHNIWGKLYMFFVTPFHKMIVPYSIRSITQK
ncbi:DUF2867 domain-containing protein [Vibrio mexicanus]|uniref:DUF2867 domain-containing protein n=1 Tax=Vibrio mexicanus TaxID=1004326 RepID=UPI00063CA4A9|nr:DUF2867 domain-containing protein [Vibrio mexicanus]